MMRALVTAAVLAAASPAAAQVSFERYGFCATEADLRCIEVVLPNTTIEIRRLSKDAEGSRVLPFYAVPRDRIEGVLVHVLEAEDAEPAVEIAPLPAACAKVKNLKSKLEALSKKVAGEGEVRVIPFCGGGKGTETPQLFSFVPVRGPGNFHGRVVDVEGALVPGTQRISVGVIRSPGQ
jgi:hypothetical protein